MSDLTHCDACQQEHPGPADEWGVYGAPDSSGGRRERLLCPRCAPAVVALFGSRGAKLEAANSAAPAISAPPDRPRSRKARKARKARKS